MRTFININYKYFIVLLILSVLFLSNCDKEDIPEPIDITINIEGVVIDSEDLSPIPNAQVILIQEIKDHWDRPFSFIKQNVNTNEAGEYNFEPVEYYKKCIAHKLSVRVEKGGYQTVYSDCKFICSGDVQICNIKFVKI